MSTSVQTKAKVCAPEVYFTFTGGHINPGETELRFQTRSYPVASPRPIRYYDDGDGILWIMRDTGGILGIVRCRDESSAYSIVGDEFRKPIDAAEVHEAYGAFDKMIEWLVSKGHEETYALREFCTRYAPQFFAIRNADDAASPGDLVEGYEYQDNATGTGIVSIDLNGESLEPLTAELLERLEIETVLTFKA